MGMLFSGDDDDAAYESKFGDAGMFSRPDKHEWLQKRERAREIATGFTSGMFERDEEVLEMVREMKEKE